ncbi:MAG TPA: response regulator transcription factor [Anaerolineaceae bacterium]|jgi:DNA-binding NarL/FixJ family response regulator
MADLPSIRVVLADDHPVMRAGIRSLLTAKKDIQVVGEASNGLEAIDLVRKLNPDVLVLDIEMPILDGIETARMLRKSGTSTCILVLSSYAEKDYIRLVLEQGVSGYLIKDEAPGRIVEAVRRVASGDKGWFSQRVMPLVPSPAAPKPNI